jgi:hypothetical protein
MDGFVHKRVAQDDLVPHFVIEGGKLKEHWGLEPKTTKTKVMLK